MSLSVIVYVEGRSDKDALTATLGPLIARKAAEGVAVKFVRVADSENRGHNKRALLTRYVRKAVDILRNDPTAVVAMMPDLSPPNVAFPHRTPEELDSGLRAAFNAAVSAKHVGEGPLSARFQVFCLKHDLEALVLASEEQLAARLGVAELKRTWTVPVEDQDHDAPPERVVERLFRDRDMRFVNTVDAPLIIGNTLYTILAERCPQCFRPFVEFLEGLPGAPLSDR